MTVVQTYDVESDSSNIIPSTWLDDESFLVYAVVVTKSNDGFDFTAFRGSVSSSELLKVDFPFALSYDAITSALGNGHGAIAFRTGDEYDGSCATDICPKFRVWSANSVSDTQSGWPTAWSVDGNSLAAVLPRSVTATQLDRHVLAAGNYFDAGPLEVFKYPTLESEYLNREVEVNDIDMAFSPSGRYILVELQDGSSDYGVVDLQTQTLTNIPFDWPTYWYGADKLVTRDGRNLVAYTVKGAATQRWNNAGEGSVGASPDGHLLVTADYLRTPKKVTVISNDQMWSFNLPDLPGLNGVNFVEPTPANDGRSTVLFTETPEMFGPLLVLQVPN